MMTSLPSGAFEGHTAVITGGGTGIGFAIAQTLVASGARVALLGRRLEVVQRAAQTLDCAGERAKGWSCDIRDEAQIGTVIGEVIAWAGSIEILVNNAGGQFPSAAENISPNGFAAVVRNNLLGTWNMTHAVSNAAMIPAKRGVILNVIANIARGFPGMAHTGAARAGVENMTKTLAVEWARYRIRVNALAPGVIDTEAFRNYPDALRETAARAAPMGRLGEVREVAVPACFLLSTWASFITGETLYVDGGARLAGDMWRFDAPSDGES